MSQHLPNLQYLDPELLQKLGDLEMVAREVVEGLRAGSHRSPLKGFSTEFAHHRQYVPGDPIRDLDWRVFGRTERYYTKLYEAETNFDCHILMDASSSMSYGSGKVSKLEYSKFLASALSYLIAKQLNDIAMQIKRRSFVILISDLFSDVDDIMRGLQRLRYSGHNVVVFHTLDPYEIKFPFKGTWKFDALEDDEELITQPEKIRKEYMTNLNEYLDELRTGCIGSGVDYTLVDTSTPLDLMLSEYLENRSLNMMGPSVGAR
jgi:uncharacterized protein (DUF58 family)